MAYGIPQTPNKWMTNQRNSDRSCQAISTNFRHWTWNPNYVADHRKRGIMHKQKSTHPMQNVWWLTYTMADVHVRVTCTYNVMYMFNSTVKSQLPYTKLSTNPVHAHLVWEGMAWDSPANERASPSCFFLHKLGVVVSFVFPWTLQCKHCCKGWPPNTSGPRSIKQIKLALNLYLWTDGTRNRWIKHVII